MFQSAAQCGRVKYSAVHYIIVRAVQYSTVQYIILYYVQCNAMQSGAVQYNTLECSAICPRTRAHSPLGSCLKHITHDKHVASRWFSPLILLLDLYEKVALSSEKKRAHDKVP